MTEIHYLKSFYPQQFSIEDAFYADAVEIIKVLIISIPFFFVIVMACALLHY
jgi:hypothetical protein